MWEKKNALLLPPHPIRAQGWRMKDGKRTLQAPQMNFHLERMLTAQGPSDGVQAPGPRLGGAEGAEEGLRG